MRIELTMNLYTDRRYYSVRRLIRKLTAGTPTPYRRMEPGTEAQVDFGRGRRS